MSWWCHFAGNCFHGVGVSTIETRHYFTPYEINFVSVCGLSSKQMPHSWAETVSTDLLHWISALSFTLEVHCLCLPQGSANFGNRITCQSFHYVLLYIHVHNTLQFKCVDTHRYNVVHDN